MLLLLLLLLLSAAPAAYVVALSRVVVVFPTHSLRYPLVLAGRETWRTTVRALVVTDGAAERAIATPLGNASLESWWEFPTGPGVVGKDDLKLAAALRIANQTFGDTYECVAAGSVRVHLFTALF